MAQNTMAEPTPAESARILAEIDRLIVQMESADERILKYQEDTARLRTETRSMIATLRTK